MKNYNKQDEMYFFNSAQYSTYSSRQRLILAYSHWFRNLNSVQRALQLTMKFKLFNATTMHNSTEKCKKKIQKNPI